MNYDFAILVLAITSISIVAIAYQKPEVATHAIDILANISQRLVDKIKGV